MRDSGKIETVLVAANHDDHQHALAALDEPGVMAVIVDWRIDVAAQFCGTAHGASERR